MDDRDWVSKSADTIFGRETQHGTTEATVEHRGMCVIQWNHAGIAGSKRTFLGDPLRPLWFHFLVAALDAEVLGVNFFDGPGHTRRVVSNAEAAFTVQENDAAVSAES